MLSGPRGWNAARSGLIGIATGRSVHPGGLESRLPCWFTLNGFFYEIELLARPFACFNFL